MSLFRWVGRAIGLDVHRDFCVIAICEDGVVRSAGRVPSTPEAIKTLAESLLPSDRVALEVTGSAWEVARILEPHVERVVVVSPDDTGIVQARAKTDRLDARALARLLWKGELESVWRPDERCGVLRRRLARREQLVHARTRAKQEVHAVLHRRLQGKPPSSDLFGVKGRQWLASLSAEWCPQRRHSEPGLCEFRSIRLAMSNSSVVPLVLIPWSVKYLLPRSGITSRYSSATSFDPIVLLAHWTSSPCGRISRPPWWRVTATTTTGPPPRPDGNSGWCACPKPRGVRRAPPKRFPRSLICRSAGSVLSCTPGASPRATATPPAVLDRPNSKRTAETGPEPKPGPEYPKQPIAASFGTARESRRF